MFLRNEIEKDSRQFMREKRTLILLFAAPILVLLVLGGVFGRTTAELGGTMIGYCDMDNSSASSLFIQGIRNSTNIIDYGNQSDCAAFVEREVREGRLTAVFIIEQGFQDGIEKGETQNLTIILDNSRIQTAPSIEAFMKAAVQETGQIIGRQFILGVWDRLDDADSKLIGLLDDVNDTRNDALSMKSRLDNTTNSLKAIDFNLMKSEVSAANDTLNAAMDSLGSASANLTQIQSKFEGYDAELNQTESDLVAINDTLANATSIIIGAKSGINCSDPIFFAYCISLDSLGSSVSSAQSSVESRIEKVRIARQDLASANATIQDFKSSIAAAQSAAGNGQDRIANMSLLVADLEKSRASALSTISDVQGSLDELVNRSYELEAIIKQSSSQIRDITSRKPESVVSPILLSSSRLFGQRTFFDFLLPSLLPLILMFVSLFLASTSLVREKRSGTLMRVLAAQVNPLEYVAKKVVSYTSVLIPEAILLTVIVSLVYGAFTVFDISTAIFVFETLVLLLLAFTAIGIVIAIYSESESTAFLASLVIGLPLLFLSGILFPFDFMPSSVATIGTASPLTQAVLSMQSVILYGSPQAIGFGILLLYAVVFSVLGAILLQRMK